jgi:hypothetical protein
MMKRFAGLVLFLAVYAAQLVALIGSFYAFNQSLLLTFSIPAILIFGWLSGGLVLGGLVLTPSNGTRPWSRGFLYALLASAIFCAALFTFKIGSPNTGRGL